MHYLIGFILGVIATFVAIDFSRSGDGGTTILTTERELQFESGIVVPEGIDLIYDQSSVEGDILGRLYLHFDSESFQNDLIKKHGDRDHFKVPYGVKK